MKNKTLLTNNLITLFTNMGFKNLLDTDWEKTTDLLYEVKCEIRAYFYVRLNNLLNGSTDCVWNACYPKYEELSEIIENMTSLSIKKVGKVNEKLQEFMEFRRNIIKSL